MNIKKLKDVRTKLIKLKTENMKILDNLIINMDDIIEGLTLSNDPEIQTLINKISELTNLNKPISQNINNDDNTEQLKSKAWDNWCELIKSGKIKIIDPNLVYDAINILKSLIDLKSYRNKFSNFDQYEYCLNIQLEKTDNLLKEIKVSEITVLKCIKCLDSPCICKDLQGNWAAHCMSCEQSIGEPGFHDNCASSEEEAILMWNELNKEN